MFIMRVILQWLIAGLFAFAALALAEETSSEQSSGLGATIKNTAKRVGKDVAESAKHTAKEIAKAGKQVGKKAADTAKSVGSKVKGDVQNKNFKPKPNSATPKETNDRAGHEEGEKKPLEPLPSNQKPEAGKT